MVEHRRSIRNRILSFVLALIMLLSSDAMISFAAGSYDRNDACEYARDHWDDGCGLCAEYCSRILKAGGINVPGSVMYRATLLREWLCDNGYGTEYACSFGSDGYVYKSNTRGDLEVGDFVFYYCSKCDDGKPYSIHVVCFAGWDSNGRMKAWSHNSANNGKNAYYYKTKKGVGKCYDCGRKITTVYTMHIKGGYGVGNASRSPIGCIDVCHGGAGTLDIGGWVIHSNGQVHAYVGGEAGVPNAEGFAVDLRTYREDVNRASGVSGTNGFTATLKTGKRGWQDVYFYAITADGSNPLFAKERVYISDPKKPYSIVLPASSITIYTGESYNLSFQVDGTGLAQVDGIHTNGRACNITFNSISGSGPWTVKGTIKGLTAGSSTLTIRLKNSSGKVEYSKKLTINVKKKAKPNFRVASVSNVTYKWYMTYFYNYKKSPNVYDSTSGALLKKDKDYTLSYKIGNKTYSDYSLVNKPSSNYHKVTVTVKGKGVYANISKSITYLIVK